MASVSAQINHVTSEILSRHGSTHYIYITDHRRKYQDIDSFVSVSVSISVSVSVSVDHYSQVLLNSVCNVTLGITARRLEDVGR